MVNGVVYTCLFGPKEDLLFDRVQSSNVDHIIFTDRSISAPSGCKVVILEDNHIGFERLSRKAKILAHKFLHEYDWSLYVDNRVRLKKTPEYIFDLYASGNDVPFFSFRHPWWSSVAFEAEKLIELGYDDERVVREQTDIYRSNGFPDSEQLIAGTVLLRRHNSPVMISVQEDWYEHVLRFSKRDQLSFNYLRWRHSLEIGYFNGSLEHNDIMEWLSPPRIEPDFNYRDYAWLSRSRFKRENDIWEEKRNSELALKIPRRHYWELERLFNKYKSDKGSIYYNAHGYCFVYETILKYLKREHIVFLEVGLLRHDVQDAFANKKFSDIPSLSAWAEYFENASIIGFDIADFSGAKLTDRMRVVQGDSSSADDIKRLAGLAGEKFDVVIEDASHASHHQQAFLAAIIDHVKPGGHIFIEDLHYQPLTLERADSPKTIDVLKAIQNGETVPSPYLSDVKQRRIIGMIESITFWDSRETYFGNVPKDALCHIKLKSDLRADKPKKKDIISRFKRSVRKRISLISELIVR